MRKFAQNKTCVENHVLPCLWPKKKRGGVGGDETSFCINITNLDIKINAKTNFILVICICKICMSNHMFHPLFGKN